MRVYYFGVRVNWDKLLAIDQRKESFKAQIFVEATLLHPQKVRERDEEDVLKFFTRATVENSLAKPKDDEFPTQDDKKNWRFVWLIHGEFGEELELQNFPFDTQDLSVMLRFGWSLSPDHPAIAHSFSAPEGWELLGGDPAEALQRPQGGTGALCRLSQIQGVDLKGNKNKEQIRKKHHRLNMNWSL